jgi:hypothetical protein
LEIKNWNDGMLEQWVIKRVEIDLTGLDAVVVALGSRLI